MQIRHRSPLLSLWLRQVTKIQKFILLFRAAVIRCLSNIAFEHRVLGVEMDLEKPCKKQLRVQFLQQEQVDQVCFWVPC